MKIKIISLILTLILCSLFVSPAVAATATMVGKIEFKKNDVETPIIQDDDGEPYSFEEIAESMGMQVYESEEAYNRAMEEQKKRDALMETSTVLYAEKEVVQTFTVMDWKNGTPVAGAVLLVNGTPRFTDYDGKVRVCKTNGSDVLVRVETEDYLPYIGYHTIAEDDKIIEIKKPNDDIELYAAVLEYEGEFFNLTEQPCYINLNLTDSYSEIVVESNVVCEEYWLYVNGEPYYYSADGIFEELIWTDFNVGDTFAVSGVYQGVESDPVNLNLNIVKPGDMNISIKSEEIGTTIDESLDYGLVGKVGVDPSEAVKSIIKDEIGEILKPRLSDIFDDRISLSFTYIPENGIYRITIGLKFDIIDKDKLIKILQKEIDENEQIRKEYGDKRNELLDKLADLRKNEAAQEKISAAKQELEQFELERNSNSDYIEFKSARRELHGELNNIEKQQNAALDEIDRIVETAKARNDIDYYNNEIKELNNVISKTQKKLNVIKNKYFNFDIDLEFKGVIEYSAFTQSFVKFNILADFRGEIKVSGQFIVVVVPVFWELKGYVDGSIQIAVIKDGQIMTLDKFLSRFTFQIIIGIRAELGVGINIFDMKLGVSGSLDANFSLEGTFEPDKNNANKINFIGKGDFNFRLSLNLYLLLWEYSVYHDVKINLFDTSNETMEQGISMLARQQAFAFMDTNIISDQLYAASYPRVGKVGDKTILTWTEDCTLRDDYNRTRLMYSVFDGETWSEPKSVCDDGRADFYQDVYSDGENLYITWQKINKVMNSEDNQTDFVAASDIVVSKFNPVSETFETPIFITNDNKSDLMPSFALKESNNDPLTVVWRNNSENDLLGLSGTNTIYYASENTNWSVEQLYEENGIIGSTSAAYTEGKLSVAFAKDVDGNIITSDSIIRMVSGGGVIDIAESGISSLKFAMLDGKPALTYNNADGILCSWNGKMSQPIVDKLTLTNYEYCENEHGKVIFYSNLNNQGTQLYCSLYNTDKGNWSKNILLSENEYGVSNPIGWVNEDGSISVVYNITDDNGNVAIKSITKHLNASIEITNAYISNLNGKNFLNVEVLNTGDTIIENISLCALSVEEYLALDSPLEIGEARYFAFSINSVYNAQMEITICAIDQEEIVAQANYTFDAIYNDLQLIGELSLRDDGKQQIQLTINDISSLSFNGEVLLHVYINGKLVDSQKVMLINGYATAEITFQNINKGDYVYISLESVETELIVGNNAYSVISMQTEVTPPDLSEINKILEDAKKLMR